MNSDYPGKAEKDATEALRLMTFVSGDPSGLNYQTSYSSVS